MDKIKMYRVGRYDMGIQERELTKVTPKTVFWAGDWFGKPREERELKQSEWANWFDTWAEAKEFLLKRERHDLNKHKLGMEKAASKIVFIENMKQ